MTFSIYIETNGIVLKWKMHFTDIFHNDFPVHGLPRESVHIGALGPRLLMFLSLDLQTKLISS